MKTLDPTHLSTHPEGDEQAVMTLSVPVPDWSEVPLNADGSVPSVTLTATGDTYMDVLRALTEVHDQDPEDMLYELLGTVITEAELAALSGPEEATELMQVRASEVVVPFRTFELTLDMSVQGPTGENVQRDIGLKITAPSIVTGVRAVLFLTKPRTLQQLAIAHCPAVTDERDEEDKTVLLVG